MNGLGIRLKEARIAKGLTLDNLQDKTKIQKRYLASIEDEDYTMMPGAFYIRVFIKQYAEAVGLDEEEMLALYQEAHGNAIQEERQKAVPAVLQRSTVGLQRNARLQEMLPKVIVALFIVMILVIIYFFLRDKSTETGLESEPLKLSGTVMSAGEKVGIDVSDAEKTRIRVGEPKVEQLTENGKRIDYPTKLVPQNIIIAQ
ncbi:helix-turn-helix domain-containing protein [Sporosarcina sp. P13]|uniref:helix-turn-helix domain-containing protein n=1 Tax=Sporosarcina sp. P13 TaxID=2048263 RepID=UPI0013044104|nr:helix-turn-helix domain-containing protein [Sporosarcina sp. P13]